MLSFLIFYVLIYGGINFACYRALAPLLPQPWMRLVLGLLIAALVVAPMGIRRFEDWGLMPGARVMSFIAWHWMAIAFWLGVMATPLLAWNACARLANSRGRNVATIPHPRAMVFIGGAVVFLLIWGSVEARMIHVREVTLTAPNGSGLKAPVRFALISDVHLSLIRGDRLARRVRDLINEANPEFLLSSGDLIDGQAVHLEGSAAFLREARAPLGRFGVLGNHEWYSGMAEAQLTHEAAGIRLLRGEQVEVRPDLIVAGSDDPAGVRQRGLYHAAHEIPNFATPPAQRPYTIYLYHQPRVPPDAAGKFDLMLSGHTHGGQIFPFGWVVRLRYRYLRGLYDLPEGGQLYVTPGTGTWGPTLRVLARPEITLFQINPAI